MLPSVKTLRPIFKDRAKEARELLEKKRKTRDYASVQMWEKQCYHRPHYTERLLCALNEIGEFYGVEFFTTHKGNEYSYLNSGDTYTLTLLYCHTTGRFRVGTWGDIVEREGAD